LVSRLAGRYRVGREVVARRMLIGGMISAALYRRTRERFQKDFERSPEDKGGIVLPHTKAVSVAGRLFTRLVIENYDEDRLTTNDVTDYLGVRPKHLPRIREALARAGKRRRA